MRMLKFVLTAGVAQMGEALLEHVADSEELHNVIMEMIGDMNASHTGISGGGRLPGQAAPLGTVFLQARQQVRQGRLLDAAPSE